MSENKNIDVSNVTLFLHSAGSGVVGIKNVIFGTWVLLYYNQVLGLEPYLASIAPVSYTHLTLPTNREV